MGSMRFEDKLGNNGYTFVRNPRIPYSKSERNIGKVIHENSAGNIRQFIKTRKVFPVLNMPIIDNTQLTNLKFFFNLKDKFRWYEDFVTYPLIYKEVIWLNDYEPTQISPTLFSLVINLREV